MNVLPLRFLKKSLLVVPLLFSLSWQVVYNMERKCTRYSTIYKVVIIEFNNSTVIITVIIFRWGRKEGRHFSVVIEQGWEKRPPMYMIRWCSTLYTGFLPPVNGKNVPFYVITILSGFFLSNYYNHVLQCPSVFCSHIYHHWLLNGLGGENSMS